MDDRLVGRSVDKNPGSLMERLTVSLMSGKSGMAGSKKSVSRACLQ